MNYYLILLIGFALSLGLTLALMPLYIKLLKSLKYNQTVSEYALAEYKEKGSTPIMGGLLFVVVAIVSALIVNVNTLFDVKCLIVILSFASFCFIGFLDDILIILRHDNEGLSPRLKLILQFLFAIVIYLIFKDSISTDLVIPLLHTVLPLGAIVYGIFMVFMYTAESNAVNFTDGMDGLSSGVSIIALIPYILFSIMGGEYDLAILLVCIVGALCGYLRYNFFPAKIFMGDSGSLGLGALFASVAVVLSKELLLIVIGGVFFVEMVCVCLQQLSVRLFHKRVFSYTPIHYAFVLKGMKEMKVVKRFYVIALIFAICGFVIGVI